MKITISIHKISLLLAFLFVPWIAKSQILKERRVYYLDCSYSMEQNKIWDLVREELKLAIDCINDETTEILVCPYAFDMKSSVKVYQDYATPAGIKNLKNIIDNLPMNVATKTYHEIPLRDFYNFRVADDRVTYMFLMTDGVSDHIMEDHDDDPFPEELSHWYERFCGKQVYGFYVMLNSTAQKYKAALDVIGSKDKQRKHHLWAYESARVNINPIRLNYHAMLNVKNEDFFEIPIYGNCEGKTFDVQFPTESIIKIKKSYVKDGKLRVHIAIDGDIYLLSEEQTIPLKITMQGGGGFDFLVSEIVNVKCVRKPERTLKISIQ